MEETLARELARAQRNGKPLALVMADLDHFKRINDSYGHPAGDVVLAHLIGACKGQLRDSDLLGREREQAELARLEVNDPLTDVPNRRGFFQALVPWMALARRPGQPTALIILALDQFKRVNDSYGHGLQGQAVRCNAERIADFLGDCFQRKQRVCDEHCDHRRRRSDSVYQAEWQKEAIDVDGTVQQDGIRVGNGRAGKTLAAAYRI